MELPGDIADIVDPISEEEDAALVRLTQEGLKTDLVSRECLMAILRGEPSESPPFKPVTVRGVHPRP